MTEQQQSQRQRLVVVTGGGTGIGRAIAGAFAASGERVVLTGRRAEVLSQTAEQLQATTPSGRVSWHRCDVSSPEEVGAFRQWLTDEMGSTVDVLVNNAGGVSSVADDATLQEATAHAWEELGANLVGSYLMVHALLPYLLRPGGRIVNISSIAALRGGGGMYSAAKAGVIGLTYSLAGDLGPDGITVNAIAPGLVLETGFFGDRMTEARLQRTISQTPMHRAGQPGDIAAAVRYLASEEASFVTGEVLHVNGGWLFGR